MSVATGSSEAAGGAGGGGGGARCFFQSPRGGSPGSGSGSGAGSSREDSAPVAPAARAGSAAAATAAAAAAAAPPAGKSDGEIRSQGASEAAGAGGVDRGAAGTAVRLRGTWTRGLEGGGLPLPMAHPGIRQGRARTVLAPRDPAPGPGAARSPSRVPSGPGEPRVGTPLSGGSPQLRLTPLENSPRSWDPGSPDFLWRGNRKERFWGSQRGPLLLKFYIHPNPERNAFPLPPPPPPKRVPIINPFIAQSCTR
ncbi:hypothetical protein QTO34_001045 [Cnephaeus nilssonii]|uniref:Uncharacterized protein n=1 Tax=Cnephaeus nilssonii TaxID=3371016 RepID=A0AA40HV89_CNENI|nr:hypothetical protein QTO34_001045 [Eptesicus nilssonii]